MKKMTILTLLTISLSSNVYADATCNEMKKAVVILTKVQESLIEGSEQENNIVATIKILKGLMRSK